MLRPPISRMGGKSLLRKKIISLIPEHTCYVEPFFGAGWVYFGKKISKVEVINDIDAELVNLFKILKFHAEEVERLLAYEISSRDIFYQYKDIDTRFLTDIQRAVRFMYVLSQSFASKGDSYGYGTTTRPRPQIFDFSNLAAIKQRLRNTYIENLRYEEIFKRYDRDYTFFFCDPPYLGTDGYSNDFTENDHLNLKNILSSINGKFLLTINDHSKIRELYKNYKIIENKVQYSISREKTGRRKFKELIISNY